MNKEYKIYIDSDGVICDFDKLVTQISGMHPSQINPKNKLWYYVEQFNKTSRPFFESMEKMPDADQLINFISSNFEEYEILTATGYTPKDACQQKINWYAKHYPQIKVNCVSKSPEKAALAASNHILIDDREKSIDPWVQAGGIGILHTSAKTTIEELKKYLTNI